MLPAARAEVVINGDDVYEDLLGASSALQDLLSDAGFATRRGIGTRRFVQGEPADLYVLYTATGAFSEEQQAGLARRIGAGAGLIALHSSNVFAGAADRVIRELLGSRYVSHGPRPHETRVSVRFVGEHLIIEGLADFEITHEHYVIAVDASATVLAVRDAEDGPQPILYVREHGAGRVCYLQLGHDLRVWDHPSVRTLLLRAARWCTDHVGVRALTASGDLGR